MARRVQALVAAAVAAFGIGLVCGATHQTKAEKAAKSFARAWSRGDTASMYRALSPGAREHYSLAAFRAIYARNAATATARTWAIGRPKGSGDTFTIPVHVGTRIFGAYIADAMQHM